MQFKILIYVFLIQWSTSKKLLEYTFHQVGFFNLLVKRRYCVPSLPISWSIVYQN